MISVYYAKGNKEDGSIQIRQCFDYHTEMPYYFIEYDDYYDQTRSVHYDLHSLKEFKKLILEYQKNKDVVPIFHSKLFDFISFDEYQEKCKNIPKNVNSYEKFGLNEEAILLFTSYVEFYTETKELVQVINEEDFWGYGIYLLEPGAIVYLESLFFSSNKEFEVLQSKGLGKRLSLSFMDKNSSGLF